jgi:hypothetical protein
MHRKNTTVIFILSPHASNGLAVGEIVTGRSPCLQRMEADHMTDFADDQPNLRGAQTAEHIPGATSPLVDTEDAAVVQAQVHGCADRTVWTTLATPAIAIECFLRSRSWSQNAGSYEG